MGIKLPDSYYTDGKTKGKTSKDTGVDPLKTAQKAEVLVKNVEVSDMRNRFYDDMEENETNSPLKKPSLNEFPKFIKKIRASEIPGLLEGLKSSKRK